MRMELLEQAFNERKANTAIEVAPWRYAKGKSGIAGFSYLAR